MCMRTTVDYIYEHCWIYFISLYLHLNIHIYILSRYSFPIYGKYAHGLIDMSYFARPFHEPWIYPNLTDRIPLGYRIQHKTTSISMVCLILSPRPSASAEGRRTPSWSSGLRLRLHGTTGCRQRGKVHHVTCRAYGCRCRRLWSLLLVLTTVDFLISSCC